MKKMVAIFMVLCLCAGLCACEKKTDSAEGQKIDLTPKNLNDYFTIEKSIENFERKTLLAGFKYSVADLIISCNQIVSGDLSNVVVKIKLQAKSAGDSFDDDSATNDDKIVEVVLDIPVGGSAHKTIKLSNSIGAEFDISDISVEIVEVSGTITVS